MVRRGNNGEENRHGIRHSDPPIDTLPEQRFPRFISLVAATENTRMMPDGQSNNEAVPEVHTRHGGQRIHVVPTHPNALSVVVADGVEETVFWRQQARGHAWVKGESDKGEEIGQCQRAANVGKCCVGRGDIVVPGNKAASEISTMSLLILGLFSNPYPTVPGTCTSA